MWRREKIEKHCDELKRENNRSRIHEVFHTLFFDNDNANSGIGSYTCDDMPNQADINMLINNDRLPK